MQATQPPVAPWRQKLQTLFFEPDTFRGRVFDKALIATIVLSTTVIILESVPGIRRQHGNVLGCIDWLVTILFSLEYILRLICAPKPLRYARSFFGIIDLLAILPQYLALFLPQSHYLTSLRILRLLGMFRIFKLTRYLSAAKILTDALHASRRKITVFLLGVILLVLILGSLMYVIEGEANGFTSIPVSIYWAIVTLTTVGYGDITPQTPLGQVVASMVMIMGYGMIAVPTGIVSAEIAYAGRPENNSGQCPACQESGDTEDARFCKHCGQALPEDRKS